MVHTLNFFKETAQICAEINIEQIEQLAKDLAAVRERQGRLFILGVGGSAGNCAHAVNDFRKLCGIETYAPTDNVSELTARTNDEGWETVFTGWLKTSKVGENDAILVFSVGGGNEERQVSMNIVKALAWAKTQNVSIFGIVGRDGGYTAQVGDNVVIVPTVHNDRVTPHAEAFQGVIWHCLVSNPVLQIQSTKW